MQMTPYPPTDMFGRICSFLATIPFYQVLPLIAIERRVASAIARDQFIYFEDKKGRPVGYASWINLDESEEDEYLADPIGLTKLSDKILSQSNSVRSNLWIMDFAGRGNAARKIARHLKQRLIENGTRCESCKAVRWRKTRDFPYLKKYKGVAGGMASNKNKGVTPLTRKARLHDIYDLAPRVRWQDAKEVRLLENRSPFASMVDGISSSSECLAAELEGRCIGICGLSPAPNENSAANIWLLSDQKLQSHIAYKARLAKKFVSDGLKKYNKLQNYIHIENQGDTMDWLRFLGFSFVEDVSMSQKMGLTIHKFEKKRCSEEID